MTGPVLDNAAARRFELAAGEAVAFVDYQRKDGWVELIHTEVPAALEGKGIGSALARGTLDLLRSEGAAVQPTCSFIARHIERHPEYEGMVAKG